MPLPKDLPNVQQPPHGGDGGGLRRSERGGAERVLANRYKMDKKLGSGAFGAAFLVADLKANRDK